MRYLKRTSTLNKRGAVRQLSSMSSSSSASQTILDIFNVARTSSPVDLATVDFCNCLHKLSGTALPDAHYGQKSQWGDFKK